MKIIIPVAGKGTRVRPHSFSKPKPLIRVGNTTGIQFVIDHMLTLKPQEIIIVHDKWNGDAFKEALPRLYPKVQFHFALQAEQLGPAHAILQAQPFINKGDEIVINYCDTLFRKDLSCIKKAKKKYDGIIFVKEVEDYERFGVVVHQDNVMTRMVEKPSEPISKLANIASYYIKDGYTFMEYTKKVVDEDIRVKGELFLSEAFNIAISDEKKFLVEEADEWLDVGKISTILETNAKILKGKVWKEGKVKLVNTTLGKNVSIGAKSSLTDCKVENSIIGSNTHIEGLTIKDSVIGDNVTLKKRGKRYNIGDASYIA